MKTNPHRDRTLALFRELGRPECLRIRANLASGPAITLIGFQEQSQKAQGRVNFDRALGFNSPEFGDPAIDRFDFVLKVLTAADVPRSPAQLVTIDAFDQVGNYTAEPTGTPSGMDSIQLSNLQPRRSVRWVGP